MVETGDTQTKKPGLAPPARLPYALAVVAWMAGPHIARELDTARALHWFPRFALGLVPALLLAYVTWRVNRRWQREQGYADARIRRRMPPEVWMGLCVLIVGWGIPSVFDVGLVAGASLMAVTIMAVLALVIVAALKDPERKAEDVRRHEEQWTDPFA